jgi:hypothetical protein
MNIPAIPFEPFPKIARLSREVVITEKIDGTSATIFIDDSGAIYAGSRTGWITPLKDNYGFASWVESNKNELAILGPGFHRGEWWGRGIQRGYGLDEKRFSLFNTIRWCLNGTEPMQIKTQDPRIVKYQDVLPSCVGLVPVLYKGIFDTFIIGGILQTMKEQGSRAVPGFMNPEGIVVFHVAGNVGFKKTIEKDDEYKGKLA